MNNSNTKVEDLILFQEYTLFCGNNDKICKLPHGNKIKSDDVIVNDGKYKGSTISDAILNAIGEQMTKYDTDITNIRTEVSQSSLKQLYLFILNIFIILSLSSVLGYIFTKK